MTSNTTHVKSKLPQIQNHPASPVNTPRKRKLIGARNWVPRGLCLVLTLGLCRVFYETWRLPPRSTVDVSEGLPLPVNANDGDAEWKGSLRKWKKEWKQVSVGSALIFSLSVALLQIDWVLHNAMGRTTAIATFLISGAGLVLSVAFKLIIRRSKDGKCPNQWIKASKAFDSLESVAFWSLLALPLVFLAWSVVLCVITVLVLSWTVQNGSANGDNAGTRIGNMTSVIFLTTLTLLVTGSVYRALKFARKLC